MLSLSLQPLLDNVERVGLGPALRILRAVATMTRRTVDGQAHRARLGPVQHLAARRRRLPQDGGAQDQLVLVHHAAAGRRDRRGRRPERLAPLESLGRHLGAAFQITDDLLNLRADPEEYGKEIGGDLWEGKRTLMLLHALRRAEPDDRDRACADPGQAPTRPSTASCGSTELLDRLCRPRRTVPVGRAEIAARLHGHHRSELKSLNDIRWLYELMHRVGSLEHARDVAARQAEAAAAVLASSRLVAGAAATATCWPTSSTTCTGGPDDAPTRSCSACWPSSSGSASSPSTSSTASAPQLLPGPAGGGQRRRSGPRSNCFSAPAARCSATPPPPDELHDLLVAEGRRYAQTPRGARLRDALVASEAVENLRRVWETVSLNVLDGPAAPNAVPDAWAELLADAVIGRGPRRLRPGSPAARGVRMTLTDPREALADQSNFIGYLVGLAGLARMVRTLAADGDRTRPIRAATADDFVYALLGLASVGAAVERLANPTCGTAESDRRARGRPADDARGGCDERGCSHATTSSAPRCWPPPGPRFQGVAPLRGARPRLAAPDQLQPQQRGVRRRSSPGSAPRVIVIAHDERLDRRHRAVR